MVSSSLQCNCKGVQRVSFRSLQRILVQIWICCTQFKIVDSETLLSAITAGWECAQQARKPCSELLPGTWLPLEVQPRRLNYLLANRQRGASAPATRCGSVREMLTFISRTIVKRTQPGQRQSVEQDKYLVHVANRGGLVAIAVMDKEYPSRSAFCVLGKMCDDYVAKHGDGWRTVTADDARGDADLAQAIVRYQDPMEADKILKIQRELDETKVVLHKTIDSVLARGEKLDNLVDKSTDLSLASQMFYKQAKKQNQCCTMM